jgi:hypothetical protein
MRSSRAWWGACLLAWGLVPAVAAPSTDVPEAAIKAVLLFKLPKFVYLPEVDKGRPARICVLGDEILGRALDRLAQANPGPLGVQVRQPANIGGGEGCDYLFIGRIEGGNVRNTLRQLSESGVVTVSDIDGFARMGGMVEFAPQQDRAGIQILINRRAAVQRDIEFNAQLLRLARIVDP